MSSYYGGPRIVGYQREKALEYAHKWALNRNPAYFDFENYGGDCTNFVSQVVFAGSGVMNFSTTQGWYYTDSYHRSPSWTSVDFLYDFLIHNKGSGPFAEEVDLDEVEPGDLIQLSFSGGKHYNHSIVVVDSGKKTDADSILTASHTDNTDNYPLTEYTWIDIRGLHIVGVRSW